jgi:hypothetical protein
MACNQTCFGDIHRDGAASRELWEQAQKTTEMRMGQWENGSTRVAGQVIGVMGRRIRVPWLFSAVSVSISLTFWPFEAVLQTPLRTR